MASPTFSPALDSADPCISLAVSYSRPLSVRLLPIPGKVAGDEVSFTNPHLTDEVVMDPSS